jgi:hypothetical protein
MITRESFSYLPSGLEQLFSWQQVEIEAKSPLGKNP